MSKTWSLTSTNDPYLLWTGQIWLTANCRPPATTSTPGTSTDIPHTTTVAEETTGTSTTEEATTTITMTTAPATTTEDAGTTSSRPTHGPGPSGLPKYVLGRIIIPMKSFWLPESQISGMYILLADDTKDGFHTDSDWTPMLHEYQQLKTSQELRMLSRSLSVY